MSPPHRTLLASLVADAPDLPSMGGATALEEHRRHRASAYAALVGPLMLTDTSLADVGRHARAGAEVEVGVLTSGGAGGLVALARRSTPGLRVSSATSMLRDLDDLAGSAARVAAAAEELAGTEVFVGLPDVSGWLRAVEIVEAAGLLALVVAPPAATADADAAGRLAQQLSVLVEADLPFALEWSDSGPVTSPDQDGAGRGPGVRLAALLLAVEALVDGADADEAAELIGLTDRDRLRRGLERLDAAVATRVRRRLRRVTSPVGATVADLTALGALNPADRSAGLAPGVVRPT